MKHTLLHLTDNEAIPITQTPDTFQTIFLRTAFAALVSCVLVSCVLFSGFATAKAQSARADIWQAGRFSFSDELGGFSITGVSGTGTRQNPYYIRQTFHTASAATLVIRINEMGNVAKLPNNNITHTAIHLQLEIVNNSNLGWIGFGFELQEIRDKPSTYGDGLSFDQLARRKSHVTSNRFARFEDQFEPGDRLVYTDGAVNSQTSVTMNFVITDFTPVPEFYLFQNPLIPAS